LNTFSLVVVQEMTDERMKSRRFFDILFVIDLIFLRKAFIFKTMTDALFIGLGLFMRKLRIHFWKI